MVNAFVRRLKREETYSLSDPKLDRRLIQMPNGRPGDHPLTDLQVHSLHPFPMEAESLLLEILKLCPSFPDDKRVCKYYAEQQDWGRRISELAQNRNVDDNIQQLESVLALLKRETHDGGEPDDARESPS